MILKINFNFDNFLFNFNFMGIELKQIVQSGLVIIFFA